MSVQTYWWIAGVAAALLMAPVVYTATVNGVLLDPSRNDKTFAALGLALLAATAWPAGVPVYFAGMVGYLQRRKRVEQEQLEAEADSVLKQEGLLP